MLHVVTYQQLMFFCSIFVSQRKRNKFFRIEHKLTNKIINKVMETSTFKPLVKTASLIFSSYLVVLIVLVFIFN